MDRRSSSGSTSAYSESSAGSSLPGSLGISTADRGFINDCVQHLSAPFTPEKDSLLPESGKNGIPFAVQVNAVYKLNEAVRQHFDSIINSTSRVQLLQAIRTAQALNLDAIARPARYADDVDANRLSGIDDGVVVKLPDEFPEDPDIPQDMKDKYRAAREVLKEVYEQYKQNISKLEYCNVLANRLRGIDVSTLSNSYLAKNSALVSELSKTEDIVAKIAKLIKNRPAVVKSKPSKRKDTSSMDEPAGDEFKLVLDYFVSKKQKME